MSSASAFARSVLGSGSVDSLLSKIRWCFHQSGLVFCKQTDVSTRLHSKCLSYSRSKVPILSFRRRIKGDLPSPRPPRRPGTQRVCLGSYLEQALQDDFRDLCLWRWTRIFSRLWARHSSSLSPGGRSGGRKISSRFVATSASIKFRRIAFPVSPALMRECDHGF